MKHKKSDARRIATAIEALGPSATPRDTSRVPRKEKLPLMARVVLLVGGSEKRQDRARAVRRSYPIRGYVGPNGGGKSLAMVNDILPSLVRGRPVLSTVKLLGPDGNPHPSYIPFTDFDQLLDFSHGDVLMDEIVGIANSRDANRLPSQIQNVLVQLRRRDITLSWSAPNWARSDKIIREVTQAVTECRGFYPARSARDAAGEIRLWAPKRVFQWRTFDTIEFEEWTAGKREKVNPLVAHWFCGPGSAAFRAYDTLDSVSMVKQSDADDRCVYCDKKKRAEYCKGHTPDDIRELEHALRHEVGDFGIAAVDAWSPAEIDAYAALPEVGPLVSSDRSQRASEALHDSPVTVSAKQETPA
jgi:hypothetical protein